MNVATSKLIRSKFLARRRFRISTQLVRDPWLKLCCELIRTRPFN